MIKLEPNPRLTPRLNLLSSVLDNVIKNYQPPGRQVGQPEENPAINEHDLVAIMKKGESIAVAPNVFTYYIENKNDNELKVAAQKVFPNSPLASVSGKFHYPKNGFMGWHHNGNFPGFRMYATRAEEDNKSFFRYRDIRTGKVITEWEKKGWNFRAFKVEPKQHYWHCVYADCDRYSFGFRFEP